MMSLSRSVTPELMDDLSIRDIRVEQAHQELKTINRFLGGNNVTRKAFQILFPDVSLPANVQVLDIGSGASDILMSLKIKSRPCYFSLDINKDTCRYSKSRSPYLNVVCADVSNMPFNKPVFDAVHASLFLHHFTDAQITELLSKLLLITRHGIIINDLRRSIFAYAGIKILTILFSKNKFVKNDAPLSVKNSFTRADWNRILINLNVKKILIKRKWAFRWLIVIIK